MSPKNYAPAALIALALLGAGCGQSSDQDSLMKNATTSTDQQEMMKQDEQEAVVKKDPIKNEEQGMMKDDQGVMVGGALMVRNVDIVENAMKANNVTTLVAAVKAAGLVNTLKDPGPFTVFAPTNNAFNKLPSGTVETLLKPENKPALTGVLTYHVVAGTYKIADLKDGEVLKTVNGATLKVTKRDDIIFMNGVQIETQDVLSSNGVTHVIGTVLMPPEAMMKN